MTDFYLNEAQSRAVDYLQKFLTSKKDNFLLLGPAGSGKTTVIVNAFNTNINIAFCAFTNKATQVLKNIANKFNVKFSADFLTIHKLLQLDITYLDYDVISFKFDIQKVSTLTQYSVIIFDECSTISKELYSYIKQAQDTYKLKYVFLGDYWQLPPIAENVSMVFDMAVKTKWLISKLAKVMRCTNDEMKQLNDNLLTYIEKIKSDDIDDFVTKYPFNLIGAAHYLQLGDMLDEYVQTWRSIGDTVIITNSRSNCEKTNRCIQDKLDFEAKRPTCYDYFNVGDRCCVDRPFEVHKIEEFAVFKNEADIKTSIVKYVYLTTPCDVTLYNGEIFDIIDEKKTKVKTILTEDLFDGQVLTIKRICSDDIYKVIHIPKHLINETKIKLKKSMFKYKYILLMSEFAKCYPVLDYGYCITLYKSQGSEWNTVYVNLNSIKWSIIGKGTKSTKKEKINLFKSTYTAVTRASNKLRCFWN